MNSKNTKRALLSSVLALVLCVSMLVGSTYAWFTDSVTTGSNIIQSGTLDIDMYDAEGVSLQGRNLEWQARDGRAQADILWEPGCTYNTQEFYIENKGNLNLKFRFAVSGIDGDAELLEVLDFSVMAEASQFNFNTGAISVAPAAGTKFDLLEGFDLDTIFYGVKHFDEYTLEPGDKVGPLVLQGHMDEQAGNSYMGLTVNGIAVSVIATQATGEEDSFDGTYDELAAYPGTGFGKLEDPANAAVEIPVRDENNSKVGNMVIPADAIADADEVIEATFTPTELYDGNFTIADGSQAYTYEIQVTNLVENNTTPIKVHLRLPAGLDENYVKLYHYDTELDYTYDVHNGYVIFETTDFSPFTVVYAPEKLYVAPDADPADLPEASVTPYDLSLTPGYSEGEDAPTWGNYSGWSPDYSVDADPKLEAAYIFSTTQTEEEVAASPYADWICDFYVSLDRDLGENEIFLGGNYGAFGWIGFHNADLTLEANTEVPILQGVGMAWTYEMIANEVGTFICGVGDVDDALKGATFTVSLRLVNPEDETEYYVIDDVKHTFQ